MKKSIISISLAFMALGGTLNAQEADADQRENVKFGVKAGLNYSNVWDEQGQDFRAEAKLGFAGGAFVAIPIGKTLGVQPEFLLSQKGFTGSGTLLGTGYSFTRTSTFIDIPLQLQIKPIEHLTILFGPQFSYLLNRKDVYTLGVNSIEQEEEFRADNIRKNILGFTAGADINVSNLVVSGRIGWDFQNNNGDGTSNTPRYKNQWLQFTLGYRI